MSQLAEHYFNEAANLLQGRIGTAFQRQKTDVVNHIETLIEQRGAQDVATTLNTMVSFSKSYDSERGLPYMGDVFEAVHDLRAEGIQPNTAEFTSQVHHMADNNLFNSATTDEEGYVTVRQTANTLSDIQQQAGDPLAEKLHHHEQSLKDAISTGDEHSIARHTRVIERMQNDIQSLNGSAVKPTAPTPIRTEDGPLQQAQDEERERLFGDQNNQIVSDTLEDGT